MLLESSSILLQARLVNECVNLIIDSYHIYYLLQGQAKCEVDGIWIIEDWSLQHVVVLQQICQQSPLVAPTLSTCNTNNFEDIWGYLIKTNHSFRGKIWPFVLLSSELGCILISKLVFLLFCPSFDWKSQNCKHKQIANKFLVELQTLNNLQFSGFESHWINTLQLNSNYFLDWLQLPAQTRQNVLDQKLILETLIVV